MNKVHKSELEYESKHPGEFPFTRGIRSNMYRGRLWTMRQYAGFGSASESNKRYQYLLSKGQMGISVAFDLPTQIGYDADNDLSMGEVGRVGVSISSVDDMDLLLKDIPLDKVSTSMTINSTAVVLLCFYIAVADKRGFDVTKLRGTIQNDVLKEYIARGTYIYPLKNSLRLISDSISYCYQKMPKWNPISISGYHIREAGSTAVQEVAFTLSNAITYVQTSIDAGMSPDDIGKRISFFLNVHNNFLEEIAKFRASRVLWAKIMRERFGSKNDESCKFSFHSQTAGSSLVAQQPKNNIVRTSYQALAAVLGGAQSLHTNSWDEALSLPTEETASLALRTQQIVAEETNTPFTVDPCGGAHTVEKMTFEIEKKALNLIQKIDSIGGMVSAIQNGWVQKEIQESAFIYQKEIDKGRKKVVGLNCYNNDSDPDVSLTKINPEIEKEQRLRLESLRKKRNNKVLRNSLRALSDAAKNDDNLIPFILNAVKSRATLGEISDELRNVFGLYEEQVVV
ncbi:MAG: methylmalonyl-CoA mutase family protein [Nitrospinota bacterium]|nr:methylmalonyl-CoA mutase family protein [Nitrospinota bacterium]